MKSKHTHHKPHINYFSAPCTVPYDCFFIDTLHFVCKVAQQTSNLQIPANTLAHTTLYGVHQTNLDSVKSKSSLLNFAEKISF